MLVQASAIGYYGPHGDEELTEESPLGRPTSWRSSAASGRRRPAPAEALGVRVARIRTGVVLCARRRAPSAS